MKSITLALVLAALGFSTSSAFATPPIQVSARVYSMTNCQYFAGTLGDFKVAYPGDYLPAGAKVIVHAAFHDSFSNFYWQAEQIVSANFDASSGYWTAELDHVTVGSRGSSSFNRLEFVVEVVHADGTRTWDNGGKGAYGHYAASLTAGTGGALAPTCQPGTFENVPVNAYTAADPSEN